MVVLSFLAARVAWSATKPADTTVRVTMTTSGGTITLKLLPEVAPKTVAQFLRLARAGVYNSVYFYRVEKGFVAQTATVDDREVPLTAVQKAAIVRVPLETSKKRHTRGVLSMAHGDDPDSGETSFSILLADAPHLDGKFTVFGEIEDSDSVLRAIEGRYNQQARDKDGKRLQILTMTVPVGR